MKTKIAIISGIIFAAILFTGITSSFMFPGLSCPAGTIVKNDVCVIASTDGDTETLDDVFTEPMKNAVFDEVAGHYDYLPINDNPNMMAMEKIELHDDNSINIEFGQNNYEWSTGYKPIPEFEYTANFKVNDTFVVLCVNIGKDGYADAHPDLSNPHLPGLGIMKYLGPITIENEPILLFWHESASIQVEMPCSYPEMIHHSINLWQLQEHGLPTDSIVNALGSNYQKSDIERTPLYYPNKRPLPNGTFDDNLENVIPWLMMQELETQGIENWKNDPSTDAHTDEGWLNPSKMCSSLFVDGETKLYISTSFYSEPELTVSEIIIDDSKPMDCQKWFWIPYGVDSKTGNLLYVYDEKSSREYYEIEITGLKDVYLVGEQYDFSYIISGYGNSCGSKTVTFLDSNGYTIGSASSASCIANLPMGIFVFDIQKEQGITYGHIELKNTGIYIVTVTFDRPSKYFPTTASQEFLVVEE